MDIFPRNKAVELKELSRHSSVNDLLTYVSSPVSIFKKVLRVLPSYIVRRVCLLTTCKAILYLVCRGLSCLWLHDLRVVCVLHNCPLTEFVVSFEMLSLIGLIGIPVVLLGKLFVDGLSQMCQ